MHIFPLSQRVLGKSCSGETGARVGVLLRATAFAFGALSMGCAVAAEDAAAEDYASEEGDGSTHAIVRIQQTTGAAGSARGDALAGFVQIPAGADASQILGLAGLTDALPPKGECWSGPELGDTSGLLQVSRAELVEADSVELLTDSGSHSLAPYAFPTVADLLRGVVYLSRDRSADLPEDGAYTIVGRGIDGGSAPIDVTSEHISPPFVDSVRINGAPLQDGMQLSAGPIIDMTWDGSDTDGDLIVVSVENPGVVWTCTFADSEEFGSIPLLTEDGTALGADGQRAALGVHRIRSNTSVSPGGGLARLTVTFDFALETEVRFSDGASE